MKQLSTKLRGIARRFLDLSSQEGVIPALRRGGVWLQRRVRREPTAAPDAAVVSPALAGGGGPALAGDTLYAFYDLDLHPISFDVGWFVMCADQERARRGLARMHVVFVPMDEPENRPVPENYGKVIDYISRTWRFENIVLPFATLLPSSAGFTVCGTRSQAALMRSLACHRFPGDHERPSHPEYYRAVIAAFGRGRTDWGFRAHVQGLRYVRQWMDQQVGDRRMVVITLRQYKVDEGRNSSPADWLAFARSLDPALYCPVFVPDTDHVFDAGERWYDEFPVFEAACWNIGLRLAINQAAYLNLFVNTGANTLCLLNAACRYIFFKVIVPGIELASVDFLRLQGFEVGTSPSYATPLQKWVWHPDTSDIILREFNSMVKRIEAVETASDLASVAREIA